VGRRSLSTTPATGWTLLRLGTQSSCCRRSRETGCTRAGARIAVSTVSTWASGVTRLWCAPCRSWLSFSQMNGLPGRDDATGTPTRATVRTWGRYRELGVS
jgi:hypothetical protein